MKNLKKVLSLALAFAMVLGLCIGASAAQDVTTLTDWNEVENKDAATLLNAFNIMQGNDDGTFAPNDNVTRAQAAKMISVALWGGSDDVALYNASNIGGYTDVVAGSWYMGYVNYMTAVKVMAGKGEGIFDPNGNVTGYELLKMCLIGLGYNPETEGLVGAGWDIKTMALATNPSFTNLTKDTTVTNWNAPLSRMNAATIISNMIKRNTVSYDLTSGVGGTISSKIKDSGSSFAVDYLKMTEKVGTLVANEYGSIIAIGTKAGEEAPIDKTARGYKEQNTLVNFDTTPAATKEDPNPTATSENVPLKLTSTADQLGSKVKAYYTNGGKTFVYAAVVEAAEVEPTFKAGELTNVDLLADGKTRNVQYVVGGKLVAENPATDAVEEDKTANPPVEAKPAASAFENSNDGVGVFINAQKTAFATKPNGEIKYYDTNGNGYIDLVVTHKFDTTKVETVKSIGNSEKYGTVYMTGSAAWNEKSYESTTANTVKSTAVLAKNADFEANKDDKFVAIESTNVFGDTTYHGYVLELVEGKVTRKATDNTAIYLDGVKYSNVELGSDGKTLKSTAVKTEGKFYVLNDAIFFSTTAESASSDTYALIYDAGFEATSSTAVGGTNSLTIQVAAILPDGTDKVFTVKDIYQNKPDTTGTDGKPVAVDPEKLEAEDIAGLIDNDGKNFASGTLFAAVKNNVTDGTENKLCAYTLNSDGTINLFLPTNLTPAANSSKTGEIYTVADGTKVATGVAKVTVSTGVDKYLTSDSVTYIQTQAPKAGTAEKWVVYKGTAAPSYDLKGAAGEAVYGTAFATEGLGIKYMAATKTTAGGTEKTGVFYVVNTPEEIDGKYVATIFSSDTGKTQEIEYTATDANKGARGKLYSEFNTNGGFDPAKEIKITATNAGYITSFGGSMIAWSILTDASTDDVTTTPLMVDKDTKYYSIAGADSVSITAEDVDAQLSVADVAAGETANTYQAVVIERMNADKSATGIAASVIIFSAPADVPAAQGGGR